jgi:hypothetical protein
MTGGEVAYLTMAITAAVVFTAVMAWVCAKTSK